MKSISSDFIDGLELRKNKSLDITDMLTKDWGLCKELLPLAQEMLQVEPTRRPTAQECAFGLDQFNRKLSVNLRNSFINT